MAVGTPYFPSGVDYTSPRYWTGVVQELAPPTDHIGDKYLPRRDMPGDKIEFDQLLFRSPIAPFVSLATETPKIDDASMRKRWADALYTRFKRVLDENDLRWLRLWGDAPVVTPQGAMAAAARRRMDRAAMELDTAVENRIEWLQINSLKGSIVYGPDSYSQLAFSITYPVTSVTAGGTYTDPSGVAYTSPALWTDHTNAEPFADIAAWLKGLFWTPKRAICSQYVLWDLQQNAHIRAQVFANTPLGAGTRLILGKQDILNLLAGEFGLTFEVYDSMYTTFSYDGTTPTEARHRYLDTNTVIFLPDGDVGQTYEAPAAQNNYATGKFTWIDEPGVNRPQDPWVTELGVGWYGIPVLNRPEAQITATVAARSA